MKANMDISTHDTLKAQGHNLIGIAHYDNNDLIEALSSWQKASELYEEKDRSGVISNLGNIYLSSNKLEKAKEYFLKAIDINKKIENHGFLVANYYNLALCYQSDVDVAIEYLKKSIYHANIAGYRRALPTVYENLVRQYATGNYFKEASSGLDSLSSFSKEMVEEINTCFKAFDEIVGTHDIEKIKTIGDAYMAAGGLPIPDSQAASKTILAALEMQSFIIDRKKERDLLGLPAFEMRVGVNTGPVVAGIVVVKKLQYDIWGDTVNTASRMESSGAVGKVNINESTYELLKDDAQFCFESSGKIIAKGKGEIQMYFVSKA